MTNANTTIAGITNVGLCTHALNRAMDRSAHLPGMTVFYGASGLGKSMAAAYAANRARAYYIECKSTWRGKALFDAILKEMGVTSAKTITAMSDQISEELAKSQRPLIVDEMDYLVEKQAVNLIRDIYEGSQSPILLIGEEHMPTKLKKWERFHGRILDFVQALPPNLGDVGELTKIYAREIQVAEDLQAAILEQSRGSVRRVCVNLDRVRQHCLTKGLPRISKAEWSQGFFTGEAPRRTAA
jgi:hypothetical protein